MMNICVVGAGAIGGWIAARLAGAGHQVMALTRGGPVTALEISEGTSTASVKLATFAGPADLVIVAVKATALHAAAARASELMNAATVVLPMLNGVPWWFDDKPLQSIDPDGAIAAALPVDRVIGAVVHASCSRPGPNRIVVKHAEKLILGEPQGGMSERVASLCTMFEQAGIRCEHSGNVRRAIWYKLWGNATVNPLSALTRAPADLLIAQPVLRAFMSEAMEELAAVGAAIGCPISESSEDRMAVTAKLGSFKPSMLQDVESGRPIELEALVGAPREIAAHHGIATPAMDRIYAMTELMAESLNLR
jgi:2-dehydropantoate 2-reductase